MTETFGDGDNQNLFALLTQLGRALGGLCWLGDHHREGDGSKSE
jgi:hypothetical protein